MDRILYRSGYKYQLAETYSAEVVICARPEALGVSAPLRAEKVETDFIDLDADGTLTIRAGYAWDGPSGPTRDTKPSPACNAVALRAGARVTGARRALSVDAE